MHSPEAKAARSSLWSGRATDQGWRGKGGVRVARTERSRDLGRFSGNAARDEGLCLAELVPERWEICARDCRYSARALAGDLGVTPRHLQRLFRARFGVAPQAWLDERRLQTAHAMLARAASVKEVAYALHFRQLSHFSRAFKTRYGCCPSDICPRPAR